MLPLHYLEDALTRSSSLPLGSLKANFTKYTQLRLWSLFLSFTLYYSRQLETDVFLPQREPTLLYLAGQTFYKSHQDDFK